METYWVNLYGGPGSGKSSMMADIFAQLKWEGYDCEMVPEYAKELVWAGATGEDLAGRQSEIFTEQLSRVQRIEGKVRVAITDSPIAMNMIYDKNLTDGQKRLRIQIAERYGGINLFVNRGKKYNPNGRTQGEAGARRLDTEIRDMLSETHLGCIDVNGNHEGATYAAEWIKGDLTPYDEANRHY